MLQSVERLHLETKVYVIRIIISFYNLNAIILLLLLLIINITYCYCFVFSFVFVDWKIFQN